MEWFTLQFIGQVVLGVAVFVVISIAFEHRAQLWSFIMSRLPSGREQSTDMDAVYIPVSARDMDGHTTAAAPTGMEARAPDMDAKGDGWEAPRVSAYGSIEDDIIFLAMRRAGPGQKHRYSANKIAQMVGGDRNQVMALVKKVRSTDPLPIFYDDLLQRIEAETHRETGVRADLLDSRRDT